MNRDRSLRERLYTIIFEHDTPAGRAFDVALIVAILLSVVAVLLDSVSEIAGRHGPTLRAIEWCFTVLFTVEYAARLYSAPQPARYAFSFFGIVDLLAILPTYASLLFPPSRFLLTIRVLRVLRVFRVLKLVRYVGEAGVLQRALRASQRKIVIFVTTVLSIVVIVGSVMYLVEGPRSGFTSIPQSVYWAIVTLTTVGYGDIAPQTAVGRTLAAILMIIGYGIIAVPTGIITVELGRAATGDRAPSLCPVCGRGGHDRDALHCKHCGERLTEAAPARSAEATTR